MPTLSLESSKIYDDCRRSRGTQPSQLDATEHNLLLSDVQLIIKFGMARSPWLSPDGQRIVSQWGLCYEKSGSTDGMSDRAHQQVWFLETVGGTETEN
jgi:hypothetical protein